MDSISSPARASLIRRRRRRRDGPTFLDRLFDHGLLIRTGVDGLYGRSGAFESVVEALDWLISRLGAADGAEVMRFPPGMSRPAFERSGYLKGFPNLAGTDSQLLRRRGGPCRDPGLCRGRAATGPASRRPPTSS